MPEENNMLIHTEAAMGWGGQEIRTFTECKWFHENGWKVLLLANRESPIYEKFQEVGIPVLHVDFQKKTQLRDIGICKKIFEKEMPYMVGTHSNIDTKVALAAATMVGVKHRIRYRHVSIPVKAKFWNKLIYRRFATQIITTGDCISQPLIKNLKLDPSSVHTIHTGVSMPENLPTREEAHKALCAELNLSTSVKFIGQVSVLRRWKGQADVMEGFDQIAVDYPDYHLVFVGGGHGEEYLPPIAAEKKHSERIHFVGHKTNPWNYFLALEMNLLASTEGEGIPQVGMQSMLCKTAFIGTKVGGIPEIVQHRETGLLVDASSPDQIASSLRMLLDDEQLKQTIVENAYQWAVTHTPVEVMANKVIDIIKP